MNRIRRRILRYVHRKPKGFRTEEILESNIDQTKELVVNRIDINSLENLEIETNIGERRSKSLTSSNLAGETVVVGRGSEFPLEIEVIDKLACSPSVELTNNCIPSFENTTVMKTNSEESFVSIKESDDDVSIERVNSTKTCIENDVEKKEPCKIIRRKELPVPKVSAKFSLLSMMRQVFGKDLSRISMPICLNEPLSFIQRISEDLEYHDLLNQACNAKCIDERVAYITVFASSAISSTFLRLSKPFNPLLGETFELTHRGFRFIAEQVMHHPPVAAYHAESDDGNWTYWGTVWSTMSFGPNSLSIIPQGTVHLKIKTADGEEEYSWERPNCIIHNIIFGSTWLEWLGDVNVVSKNHGYKGKTSFFTDSNNSYSWSRYNISSDQSKLRKRRHIVAGSVFNESGQRLYCIEGQSDYEIQVSRLCASVGGAFQPYSSSKVVWRCNPHPNGGDNSQNYFLTYMALELNEISDDYNPEKGANMPITDSRFRPDQRLYESGDVDGAQVIKGLLEEKQRKREKSGTSAVPRWFIRGKKISPSMINTKQGSVSKDVVEFEWDFTNEYWNYKNTQIFSNLNDIVDIFNVNG
ncbi:oxysterol binding protein [Cryptosporidium canis]|uniref:Oxysterol binding protein n=1 Tax=Cryptosporidium canis TaxID=195482 RepID=A0A9D5DMV0_9CRYT|nr:oxysterol binding protein [Cryptosporidium canis]